MLLPAKELPQQENHGCRSVGEFSPLSEDKSSDPYQVTPVFQEHRVT